MLSKYFLKSMLRNKNIWGWGLFFMVFWLFMGAFVFNYNTTNTRSSYLYLASTWFGLIGLISTSTISTSIAYSIYYGNSSLAYVFKFTKLRPSGYISSFMLSTAIVGAILSAFMLLFTFIFFSYKSGYMLVPTFSYISIVVGLASGTFMFLLASIIIIVVNNYLGLRNISFATFIPMILTYLFGFSQLNISLPSYIVYGSPFTDISDLFIRSYDGKPIPINLSDPANYSSSMINPYYQAIILGMWIIILTVISLMLIRRIKPRPIEDARQV
ncbi:MAG: hypothetical protein ACYDAO_06275 [Thermoplasmataceae archaeon]